MEEELLKCARRLLAGEAKWIDLSELPNYTLRERMTERKACFSMRDRLLVKMKSMLSGQTYILSVKKVRAFDEFDSLPDNLRFI